MSSCDAVLLKKEYEKLKAKLDDSFVGDWFIKKSVNESISRLKDIIKIQKGQLKNDKVMPYCHLSGACAENVCSDACLSSETKKWRQHICIQNFNKIPDINKKEVFDCFFRYDTYGKLYNDDIIFLSRGVEDPEYFSPPAIVNVALDVANKQNWFGYSDSLGYIDTRIFLDHLKKVLFQTFPADRKG